VKFRYRHENERRKIVLGVEGECRTVVNAGKGTEMYGIMVNQF
jgi:hypothetical protein